MTLSAEQVLDASTRAFIRSKARQLTRLPGLSRSDREDIEQDLTLTLLKQLPSFDAQRGDRHVFVKTVIERAAARMAVDRKAAKRDPLCEASLHELVPDESGADAELGETLIEDVHERRFGTRRSTDHDKVELRHDVAVLMDRLPTDLREIAELLQHHSKAEAARRLGIPRTTLNDACRRIRSYFREPNPESPGVIDRPQPLQRAAG
jgi:DNA-directed RNA polymerase specialized sigma24 family protein